MENRDKDKMSQRDSSTQAGEINRTTSQQNSKGDSSASFGRNIGRSEGSLNEPSSRTGGSVGSSGMKGSTRGSDREPSGVKGESSGLDSSVSSGDKKSDESWGDSGKGSQGSSRH